MPKTIPDLPGIEPSDLPFSQVVEAGGLVFLAGQVGSAPGSAGCCERSGSTSPMSSDAPCT